MKILITGCAGFIGSHLINDLSKDYDVWGIDNLSYGYSEAVKVNNWSKAGFETLTENFLKDFDYLVHLATVSIQPAYFNPVETFRVNTLDTIDLFSRFRGKIVYTSTASVYGNSLEIPTTERAKIECLDAYSISKRITELYLQSRGNYTTLRLSNVYGSTVPNRSYQNVIESFKNADRMVVIKGDGKQTRDFTHVEDVIRALKFAIDWEAKNTEVNISSGIETSLNELAQIIDKEVTYFKPRPGDEIKRRCIDNKKALNILGWRPMISLEEGIKSLNLV
jgi:UDP-glucose 4-epimerase